MTKEPTIYETYQKYNEVVKKIIKVINKNKIPNDYEGMKSMRDSLQQEETKRMEMNKLREQIKGMLKHKKQLAYWKKIDRRMKIRKFLHLPYKTLNEFDFMKQFDEEE